MFNRKKPTVNPPVFDKHRLFNRRLETELGLYVLNGDMITLFQDKCGTVDFAYLGDYIIERIWSC
jgi:hypothetical protein